MPERLDMHNCIFTVRTYFSINMKNMMRCNYKGVYLDVVRISYKILFYH